MTDHKLLQECLDAFRAMDTAAHANKFLKSRGMQYAAYSGSGQNKLRAWMIRQLEAHIALSQG